MPSENVATSEPIDRRARKREARRDHLLDLALDIVDDHGVDGLTMAALADAGDYATASLYTYFSSRSALMAALQERALVVLARVGTESEAAWDRARAAGDRVDLATSALAKLCAFSDLFLDAPVRHRREFRLQQQLLVTPGVEDVDDAGGVVPAALHVLAQPQRLLAAAAEVGAMQPGQPMVGPLGETVDASFARTLAWVVALNGALLTDGLVTGLPTTGEALGSQLTDTLLVGWGADAAVLASARALSADWARAARSEAEA
ncbi:TetR/AcrR family transcriptional regulator [Aquihabitans sp. McL0605]|uniref:TetR/AcrR family transcriptional regulator n=1 Tax=Aquihabitans sp. McL0605 TaxID=3415671 RepID=UPI003CE97392